MTIETLAWLLAVGTVSLITYTVMFSLSWLSILSCTPRLISWIIVNAAAAVVTFSAIVAAFYWGVRHYF